MQHIAQPCFQRAAEAGEERELLFSFFFSLLFSSQSLCCLQSWGAEFWVVLKRHLVVVKRVSPMLLNHTMTLFMRSPLSRQSIRG